MAAIEKSHHNQLQYLPAVETPLQYTRSLVVYIAAVLMSSKITIYYKTCFIYTF